MLATAVFVHATRQALGRNCGYRSKAFDAQQDAREWLSVVGPSWLECLCLYGLTLHFPSVEQTMRDVLCGVCPPSMRRDIYTLDELIQMERRSRGCSSW